MSEATRKLTEYLRPSLSGVGLRGLRAVDNRPRGYKAVKPAPAQAFMAWVRREHPILFRAAEKQASKAGLGQVEAKTAGTGLTIWQRLVNTVTDIAPQYLQYQAQKDLLEVQLQRASQGLPPLDPTSYAPAVQVSIDPVQAQLAAEAAWDRAKPFVFGSLALVGGWLLLRGRR